MTASSNRGGASIRSADSTGRIAASTEQTNTNNHSQPAPSQTLFRVPQSPRSAIGESQAKAAKVAIPRLKRPNDFANESTGRGGGRHRVNHACEPCRHRKTKCSGEKPVCRHCQDFKIACFYADGKRDRVKKQFGTMAEKVAEYERILRDLTSRVSEDDAEYIRAALDRAAQVELDDSVTESAMLQSIEGDGENDEPSGAESEASAHAGSTGAMDRTSEDFTQEDARATGFIGKNADITWMQRLKQENDHNGSWDAQPTPAADGNAVRDSSYYLDDLPISTYEAVDPYEMPTAETARELFTSYMRRVHSSFPIVGRVNLTMQFQRFVANPVQKPPAKWLAIINLIFAIGARYSHLVHADSRGDERDHMIYFIRARLLVINQETLFVHPDLQHIQVLGLTSFYLMCTSQINRSWTVAGVAIRAAVSLGLNMRNDSEDLKDSLKEIRYRLWWALYSLEHQLCSLTGRSNSILAGHSTTPLPCPIEEETFESDEGKQMLSTHVQQAKRSPQANSYSPKANDSVSSEKRSVSGKSDKSTSPSTLCIPQAEFEWAKNVPANASLYFLHLIQLVRLSEEVFQELYNPDQVSATWSSTQRQIGKVNGQLEAWYRDLPSIFDFRRKQRDHEFREARISLGFFYYGAKQLIYRPCLCRLDQKLPDQSARSHEFNRMAAVSCVEAAQDSLRLIPDEPNTVGLITVGPWWTTVHWLVQSTTVLLLELAFRSHHMPEEADNILESAKKAVRWLHALGHDDASAKRAWTMCNRMLYESAAKIGRRVTDVPTRTPGGSNPSPEEDLSTSRSTGAHSQVLSQPYEHSVNGYATVFGSNLPVYHGLNTYDSIMRYDQYYPGSGSLTMAMHGDPSTMYNSATGDPEMTFTNNTYHDDQAQHQAGHNDIGGHDLSYR